MKILQPGVVEDDNRNHKVRAAKQLRERGRAVGNSEW